jgi:putative transposase
VGDRFHCSLVTMCILFLLNEWIKNILQKKLASLSTIWLCFFITIRLNGSLPKHIVEKFNKVKVRELDRISSCDNKKVKAEKYLELKRKYFEVYDIYLDKALYEPKWLKKREVATIVKEAIYSRDGKEYELIAYTIMSNHAHLVILPIVERDLSRSINNRIEQSDDKSDMNVALQYPVTNILRKLKGSTARECNKILRRSGKFWQHESYDHAVRDGEALRRIVKYVLNNPVKAELAESWEEWEWNYYNGKFLV